MGRWIEDELDDITVRRGMAVIAEIVRRGRHGADLTQTRLGSAAGLHQATISRLERAELRSMRLVRLARLIGTIVEYRGLAAPDVRPRRRRHPPR
jgi:transcriptional regulator with XRE-family HTH domain